MLRSAFFVFFAFLAHNYAAAQVQEKFAESVYPMLQKAGCAGCHNHDGVASGTKLQFPEPGASEQ